MSEIPNGPPSIEDALAATVEVEEMLLILAGQDGSAFLGIVRTVLRRCSLTLAAVAGILDSGAVAHPGVFTVRQMIAILLPQLEATRQRVNAEQARDNPVPGPTPRTEVPAYLHETVRKVEEGGG